MRATTFAVHIQIWCWRCGMEIFQTVNISRDYIRAICSSHSTLEMASLFTGGTRGLFVRRHTVFVIQAKINSGRAYRFQKHTSNNVVLRHWNYEAVERKSTEEHCVKVTHINELYHAAVNKLGMEDGTAHCGTIYPQFIVRCEFPLCFWKVDCLLVSGDSTVRKIAWLLYYMLAAGWLLAYLAQQFSRSGLQMRKYVRWRLCSFMCNLPDVANAKFI